MKETVQRVASLLREMLPKITSKSKPGGIGSEGQSPDGAGLCLALKSVVLYQVYFEFYFFNGGWGPSYCSYNLIVGRLVYMPATIFEEY
jgi:hypothetical protein